MEQYRTVGRFTYRAADSTISGPEQYMREQGLARIASWGNAGARYDQTLANAYEHSGDMILAMLVTLQTDYAGWKGTKIFVETYCR